MFNPVIEVNFVNIVVKKQADLIVLDADGVDWKKMPFIT